MIFSLRDDLYSALTHALEDSPGLLADLVSATGEKSARLRKVALHSDAVRRITAFINHLHEEPMRPYFGTLTPHELKARWLEAIAEETVDSSN
jgi:hypothetical protein